jgi:hypothetical protein
MEIMIDPSVTVQQYIEDCQVCCRPITLKIDIEITDFARPLCKVQTLHENEYWYWFPGVLTLNQ